MTRFQQLSPNLFLATSPLDLVTQSRDQSLGRREVQELSMIKAPNRRRSYLAGRQLAKNMFAVIHDVAPNQVEILSRDERHRSTRPQVLICNKLADVRLSIAHNSDKVLVVVSTEVDAQIGCDLETAKEFGPAFRETWFTELEREHLNQLDCQSRLIPSSLIWSAKEAVYKAVNRGETFKPRRFEVEFSQSNRWRCKYNWEHVNHSCQIQLIEMDNETAVVASCANRGVHP